MLYRCTKGKLSSLRCSRTQGLTLRNPAFHQLFCLSSTGILYTFLGRINQSTFWGDILFDLLRPLDILILPSEQSLIFMISANLVSTPYSIQVTGC